MSSAGAVVFAYLGEFLTTRNRSRSIMIASIVFGIISTAFPITAYFIINQNWKLYIGCLNIYYKPWRLFVLMCGIPSLICGIAFIFLPESPKFCFSKVRSFSFTFMTSYSISYFNFRVKHKKPWKSSIKFTSSTQENQILK